MAANETLGTDRPEDAWMVTPLGAFFERARTTPDATALVAAGETWSCGRLATESARVADGLRSLGVGPGDRVALHMMNHAEAVVSILASWMVGAIVAPVGTRYKQAELGSMLARLRPTVFIGHVDLLDVSRDVGLEVVAAEARYVVGLADGDRSGRPFSELALRGDGEGARTAPSPGIGVDAPAVLLATSGTTGESKLVVWTHRTLSGLVASAESRGVMPDDVLPLDHPLAHASGACGLSICLLTGAVPVLLVGFDPDRTLEAVEKHRCTTLVGLPFMCSELARCQRARPRDVSSLRIAWAAGDKAAVETEAEFEATFGLPLLSTWAATEEVGAGAPAAMPGPLTRFLPGTRIALVDEAGEEVAEGAEGEMLIRSATTSPGYWLDPDRIEPMSNGMFRSGDIMRRERDGQTRFVGRVKDVVVTNGSNVSPAEVEEVLRRQPGIADAAVVGVADTKAGQRVVATVVLARGAPSDAVTAGLARAGEELADYKVPETAVVVDRIPRNALGKVDRVVVARDVAERSG